MTAIYITEPEAVLKVHRHKFQIFRQHTLRLNVPVRQTSQIIAFAGTHLQRQAAFAAQQNRIPVLFLERDGRYLGRLEIESQQPAKHLAHQMKRSADTEYSRAVAESAVRAKLHNCSALLLQLTSAHCTPAAKFALDALALIMEDLPAANSITNLREYQATGATFYYRALTELLASAFYFQQPSCWQSAAPIHALLRVSNAFLQQAVWGLALAKGLHPGLGHLHAGSEEEMGLIKDLAAEWSAVIADKLIAELVYGQIITPQDIAPPNGRPHTAIQPHALKTVAESWEKKMQMPVTCRCSGEISYRQYLELQVLEYIASLRGDVECYRPALVQLSALPVFEGGGFLSGENRQVIAHTKKAGF
jgi:CRISPR-associated protein Cas1